MGERRPKRKGGRLEKNTTMSRHQVATAPNSQADSLFQQLQLQFAKLRIENRLGNFRASRGEVALAFEFVITLAAPNKVRIWPDGRLFCLVLGAARASKTSFECVIWKCDRVDFLDRLPFICH